MSVNTASGAAAQRQRQQEATLQQVLEEEILQEMERERLLEAVRNGSAQSQSPATAMQAGIAPVAMVQDSLLADDYLQHALPLMADA